jgi:hypothetical protein
MCHIVSIFSVHRESSRKLTDADSARSVTVAEAVSVDEALSVAVADAEPLAEADSLATWSVGPRDQFLSGHCMSFEEPHSCRHSEIGHNRRGNLGNC